MSSTFEARYNNLVSLFNDSLSRNASRPLFGTKKDGQWNWITYGDFARIVDQARAGLAQVGVTKGDRVAVIANNRVEWAASAYGTYGLGGAFVPMYEAQQAKEWKFILNDSNAKVAFVSTPEIAKKVNEFKSEVPSLQHVIVYDAPASDPNSWTAFLANGASFVAVLVSLALLRVHELIPNERAPRKRGGFREGLVYVWGRADLRAAMLMLFFIGTFGMNFAIWISTMAVSVFHTGAHGYGGLSSAMAIGTVSGAFLATQRDQPTIRHLLAGTAVFAVGCLAAMLSPGYWTFAASLVVIGVAVLSFLNASNALVQLTTEPHLRGRVMSIRLAITLGGTPIGAPLVGWAADTFGPRWSLAIGVAAGVAASAVGATYLMRRREEKARVIPAIVRGDLVDREGPR